MATIITGRGGGDDTREFYREAYVQNQWGDSEYLNRVNDRAREYENSLVGNARTFYEALPERARVSFDVDRYIEDSRRALSASNRDMSRVDAFIPLQELAAIQRAPRVMRPYLLAQPTINREVRANRLQGYDEPAKEQPLWQPRDDGKLHAVDNPYFLQVTVGTDVMDGDDLYHNAAYVVTSVGQCAQYVQLTSMERQSVLDVWDNMLRYHDEGHDVTSPGGGMR